MRIHAGRRSSSTMSNCCVTFGGRVDSFRFAGGQQRQPGNQAVRARRRGLDAFALVVTGSPGSRCACARAGAALSRLQPVISPATAAASLMKSAVVMDLP
jgi:hypothetical protein